MTFDEWWIENCPGEHPLDYIEWTVQEFKAYAAKCWNDALDQAEMAVPSSVNLTRDKACEQIIALKTAHEQWGKT